jgi:hypothetical protein
MEFHRMKRSTIFAAFAALFLCASLPLHGQDNMPPETKAPASQEHHPLPKPTNLMVLPKDITPDDLMKRMHGYSEALGVHCNFCHEVDKQTRKPNFAADTKPDKTIARTMIAMTQDINTKFMTQIQDPDATPADKTVTCGTCHRGNTMPVPFTPKPGAHHDHPAGDMPMKKPQ